MLNKLKMGVSPLTDNIYIGRTLAKSPGVWAEKREFTNEFLATLIQYIPPGEKKEIRECGPNGDRMLLITVTEVQNEVPADPT